MKFTHLICLGALLFSSVALAHFENFEQFDKARQTAPSHLKSKPDKSLARLERVSAIAGNALSDAISEHSNPEWSSYAAKLYGRWLVVEVKAAPYGEDYILCMNSSTLLAFNYPGNPEVYLCNNLLQYSDEKVGQTVLHEVVHSFGVVNECETTRIEKEIMLNSRYGIVYKNGYWTKCGL